MPGSASGFSAGPMVKVPSLSPTQRTVGASGVRAEREMTSIVSATRKQDSRPMPNWPRNWRRTAATSDRFEVLPMIDSSARMSVSVRPMPLSRTTSCS